jgi:DNA-binding NtrC family response regulator
MSEFLKKGSAGRTSSTEPQLNVPQNVPRLEIVVEKEGGKTAGRRLILDGDVIRIGSHPSSEVVITDPQVSRLHCQLRNTAAGWRVNDTGSLNGTRVGGVTVRDADLVLPECRVEVGQTVVSVRALEAKGTEKLSAIPSFGALFGGSALMRRLFERLQRVAQADSDVLIEGESGTGKELIAAEIVKRGARANGPFVIVDCGAISRNLIESELFGHAKGAFTGAERQRTGAFEAADGGTVFLDEIGELPIEMQPKLLRALAAREVRRMGENQPRKFDVRVIAATNRRLEGEINQGRFREDLYFRLSVLRVDVPPLRERSEDLPILIGRFLEQLGQQDKMHRQHNWPGNVRELRNYVERFAVFDDRSLYQDEPRPEDPQASTGIDIEVPFRRAKDGLIESFERRYLEELLKWSQGNVSRAARKANLDRMYLHRLLQRHGLRRGAPLSDEA